MHKVIPMTCAPSQQLLSVDGELLTINLGLALAIRNWKTEALRQPESDLMLLLPLSLYSYFRTYIQLFPLIGSSCVVLCSM